VQPEKTAVFCMPGRDAFIGKGIGVGGGCLSGIVSFDMEDLVNNREKYPQGEADSNPARYGAR
jgi:hypothetical protein